MIVRVALIVDDCVLSIVCVTDAVPVFVGKLVTVWTVVLPTKLVLVSMDVLVLGETGR